VLVPLTTAQRRLGVLSFGRGTAHGYAESEIAFMQQVARQVAVAVDKRAQFRARPGVPTAIGAGTRPAARAARSQQRDGFQLDLRSLLNAISASLRRVIHHEYTSLALYEEDKNRMRMLALDFPQGKGLIHEEMLVPLEGSIAGSAFRSRRPVVLDHAAMEGFDSPTSRLNAGRRRALRRIHAIDYA